jgi:hypothetical protein
MTGRPMECGDGIYDDGEWISWEWINGQLHEQEVKQEYPQVDPQLAMLFEELVENARFYHQMTGRYLQIWGEIGELYAEVKYGMNRQTPHAGFRRQARQRLCRDQDHLPREMWRAHPCQTCRQFQQADGYELNFRHPRPILVDRSAITKSGWSMGNLRKLWRLTGCIGGARVESSFGEAEFTRLLVVATGNGSPENSIRSH